MFLLFYSFTLFSCPGFYFYSKTQADYYIKHCDCVNFVLFVCVLLCSFRVISNKYESATNSQLTLKFLNIN